MKNFRRVVFLLAIELFAREHKYAWNTTGTDLSQDVHLLLKEGLKIGYLPVTARDGSGLPKGGNITINVSTISTNFSPPAT